jgi:hypothetical protein
MRRRSPTREEKMTEVKLTEEQQTLLREVLEAFVAETRMEVSNTDSKDFRDDLKRKEAVAKAVLEKLGS